jgi:hypothetical protein
MLEAGSVIQNNFKLIIFYEIVTKIKYQMTFAFDAINFFSR